MRTLALICLLLLVAAPLASQQRDAEARRIVDRPEYQGYRIEKRKPAEGSSGGDGESGADSGDAGSGDSGSGYRRGTGAGGPRRGTGAEGPQRGQSGGGDGLSFPSWIGSLFEALAWIVMIAVAAIALFFIVKALMGIKRKPKKKSEKSSSDKKKAPEGEVSTVEEPDGLEQVFEDALVIAMREYKEALAREDYAAATLLGYRIFWLRAGWRGCVENTDVRTWRDAVRMVRAAERRQEVRDLLRLVERVRYAEYVPNKGEFNSWSLSLERIEPTGVLQ
ncbi:MAG: hypothetical protein H6839_17645 [Planctomycetes bacterium]|nr:hypothetical protein [Planctomycetota bacterium]